MSKNTKTAKFAKKENGNFRSTFDVFGVYTHGKKEGQTNPKAVVSMTFYGTSFKDCKNKLISQTVGALYKPTEIVDLDLPVIRPAAQAVASPA